MNVVGNVASQAVRWIHNGRLGAILWPAKVKNAQIASLSGSPRITLMADEVGDLRPTGLNFPTSTKLDFDDFYRPSARPFPVVYSTVPTAVAACRRWIEQAITELESRMPIDLGQSLQQADVMGVLEDLDQRPAYAHVFRLGGQQIVVKWDADYSYMRLFLCQLDSSLRNTVLNMYTPALAIQPKKRPWLQRLTKQTQVFIWSDLSKRMVPPGMVSLQSCMTPTDDFTVLKLVRGKITKHSLSAQSNECRVLAITLKDENEDKESDLSYRLPYGVDDLVMLGVTLRSGNTVVLATPDMTTMWLPYQDTYMPGYQEI